MSEYMQTYAETWQDIVENKDGTLNKDQVARELADYLDLMGRVSEVYGNVTGGRISKPETTAEAVTEQANNHVDDCIRSAIKDIVEVFKRDGSEHFSFGEIVDILNGEMP